MLEIDPITIRSINCLKDFSQLPTGTTLPGRSSFPALIKICAETSGCTQEESGWKIPQLHSQGQKLGYGFALGIKATGYGYGYPEGSYAKIILYGENKIENAEVYCSASELGQGASAVLAQLAAKELLLAPEMIQVILSDTDTSEDSGATNASRITFVVGNAIRLAAQKALEEWQDEARPAVGEGRWTAPLTTAPDPATGACSDNISYSYAALAALVNLDYETGEVGVEKVYIAQDVGNVINPMRVEGQIEGAIVQAIGWTLFEDLQINEGNILSDSLGTYLIPTSRDTPKSIESCLLENPDPNGPYGARGAGEIPFVPVAPAVVAGLRDACGTWFNQIPLKPEVVLSHLPPK
jgi:CO/xanthine dehydrogenase Mo-binding subunit